jgi:23S rRNA pseudouridine1911/1915/1917 synthase
MEFIFEVLPSEAGKRIDVFLSKKIGRSREYCKNLIEMNLIKLENLTGGIKSSYHIRVKDIIHANVPEEKPFIIKPQKMEFKIIFENNRYFVINKPPGLVVHPAAGNYENTLVNALIDKISKNFTPDDIRPGIIHRLDKDTSGVLLIAKDHEAKEKLAALFKNRLIKKVYHAISFGIPDKTEFIINAPIARHPKLRKQMAVVNNGKESITEVKVKKIFENAFLSEILLRTGRTHQIRVHLKYRGYPVVGDKTYGTKGSLDFPIQRQALHAYSIEFNDPFSGEQKCFVAEYPEDFVKLINHLSVY